MTPNAFHIPPKSPSGPSAIPKRKPEPKRSQMIEIPPARHIFVKVKK